MEAFLRAWLPRFIPQGCSYQIYSYQGKQALLRKIEDRLRACARWIPDGHRIVILVDQDDDPCTDLKSTLEEICARTGLRSRRVGGPHWQVTTRIAIEELEAWYFGAWQAVREAYPRVPSNVVRRKSYRNPDAIKGGTWEAFQRIMQKHGYFKQGLNKVEAASAVGKHIDPNVSASRSFAVFRDALIEAIA